MIKFLIQSKHFFPQFDAFEDNKLNMHTFHINKTTTTTTIRNCSLFALSSEIFVPLSCPDLYPAIWAAERLRLKSSTSHLITKSPDN